ncbi:MAG: hypothetical protein M1136_07140 [Chloroflexi bacterium]|nr:hypothetical protein [Chloroflexota bacterium]MCL5075409.1 hypothetical protein [Chloroflexota bacterium]
MTPTIGLIFLTRSESPEYVEEEAQHREYRQKSMEGLAQLPVNIPLQAVVRTRSEAITTIQEFKDKDVDLIILGFAHWVSEDLPIYFATELRQPLLLWSLGEGSPWVYLSGLVSTASNLARLGRQFAYVIGAADEAKVLNEILIHALASAIAKRLRHTRLGLVGYACPGMIDAGLDEIGLRRLGLEVVRLDALELLAKYENLTDQEADNVANVVVCQSGKVIEPTHEELRAAANLYLALKAMVNEYALDGIGVRCWPEIYHRFSPCLAFSQFMDEGIIGVCENDATAAVTMFACHWLTNQPVFLGDIGAIIPELQAIQLWHCGHASLGLASTQDKVRLRKNQRTNIGVTLEFPLRQGRVTLAKLTKKINGQFRLFTALGQSIEGPPGRGNIAYVQTDTPVREVLDTMITKGVEHHLVMAYGDIRRELSALGRLLGVEEIYV